uniref:JMS09K11.6 protein n=1 Tax=Rhizophora mucronata TaxID=61149 RepID=A0A2P2PPE8_RHIMU
MRAFLCKRAQSVAETRLHLLPRYGWCQNTCIWL